MKRFIGLITLITLAFFSNACVEQANPSQEDLEDKLKLAIETVLADDQMTTINLQAITTFSWNKFYIFTPYMSTQQINQTLGFDWKVAKKKGIDYRDDINLLVFVENGNVVHYLEYPRSYGDFFKIQNPNGFSPAEAVFEVTEEDIGEPWIILNTR